METVAKSALSKKVISDTPIVQISLEPKKCLFNISFIQKFTTSWLITYHCCTKRESRTVLSFSEQSPGKSG